MSYGFLKPKNIANEILDQCKKISTIPTKYIRPKDNQKYIPQLDGLRCLAVLMVLLWHSTIRIVREGEISPSLQPSVDAVYRFVPHGEVAVDLFFIISGFIIAKPFLNRAPSMWKIVDFYLRRLKRIHPPYIIALLLCSLPILSGFFHVTPHHNIGLYKNLFASLFYICGILYNSDSYFIPPTWSLEVEAQFYIAFPLIMLAYLQIQARKHRMLAATALACMSIIAASYWHNVHPFDGRFRYAFLAHFHLFLLGIILSDFSNSLKACQFSQSKTADLIFAVGLMALLATGIELNHVNAEAPGFWLYASIATGAGLSSCMVFLGALYGKIAKHILSLPWICLTGTMCYSIYLLHDPLMEGITKLFIHRITFHSPALLFAFWTVAFLSIAWTAGFIYYTCVERPFMNRKPTSVSPSLETTRLIPTLR
ncbi:acyltransferase family protein [Kozakia baliensis]|uniref:Uncharacterized protein n=1 Tax=Kozakia baliensis TaxID=153496 RepID=A0A1D8UQS3_9PROT|nr:acyltransferase [Kozakia baliensis]AOX15988.1 hypothetical protein A0U89_01275 [Kozakia baliensis]GEL64113.1 hypothetical protein KBA01_13990 [Kozakia baliensis]